MKKITYDATVDAAYIYLQSSEDMGNIVTKTYCCNADEVWGMINIDFDNDGKIFWIELIPGSLYLSDAILKNMDD